MATKKSVSKALQARGNRQIESKNAGVGAKAKQGKEKVAAGKKILPIVIGLGVAHFKLVQESGKATLQSLKDIGKHDAPTIEQAMKEMRIEQYRAQCKVVGKEYKEGMKPENFMAKQGTLNYRKQRSISASISRSTGILKAYSTRTNVDKMNECTSLNDMYAYATKSGGKSEGKSLLKGSGFDAWNAKTARIVDKATDAEGIARLEKHLITVMKIAQKFSHALSDNVKAALNIQTTRKLRAA